MSTFRGIDTIEQLKTWLPGAEIPDIGKRTPSKRPAKHAPKEFVEASVRRTGPYPNLKIIIPTETKSESNQRDTWGRVRRTKSAKAIFNQTMRPYYVDLNPLVQHFDVDGIIRVTFTRLGGRKLDSGDNLNGSMKALKDAVAAAFLADDGDPRFIWQYDQEPGGPIGVRIEIERYIP